MIGEFALCLFGAGAGSYAAGNLRARDIGYRLSGLALMGTALALAATPARADQFRQAADNAEVRCAVSSRELTRISLVGDAFANVSKITTGVPGEDFTITSEPVRGDIYLSVPDGWTAPTLSFFATSRKGYVYKFACTVTDVPAEQVFVANPALAATSEPTATLSSSASAVDLIKAMAADVLLPGYTVRQPADTMRRLGDLELRLIAEYRGAGLVGKQFRIDNHARTTTTLDPTTLAPGATLAVSLGTTTLAPHAATSLYVVLPAGEPK